MVNHDDAMALAGTGVRVASPTCQSPGTKLRFRSYDAHGFGWYAIGTLSVSADGKQLAAAPGVTLGETGCHWIIDALLDALKRFASWLKGLDPVNVGTVILVYERLDLLVPMSSRSSCGTSTTPMTITPAVSGHSGWARATTTCCGRQLISGRVV